MAPSTASVRAMTADFVKITGAPESTAKSYLKASGYRVEAAMDAFYNSSASSRRDPLEPKLEELFESLRDENKDEKDKMELESTMAYLTKLHVNIENVELFVALETMRADTIGEIGKKGFVEGWKTARCDDTKKQAAHIKSEVKRLSTDAALFKRVYKHAFIAGKENDQKSLSLENAFTFWGTLFDKPGWRWVGEDHDWLELWKKFLNEKWTRSVNKDMWNMTLEFALKSVEDESLSFWNENGAWPSVIDDFVEWCKANGIAPATPTDTMDVDATD